MKPNTSLDKENDIFLRIGIFFIIIKILELSRFNINDLSIKRSFYDALSLCLFSILPIYYFLSKSNIILRIIEKIKSRLFKIDKRFMIFFDLIVLTIVVFYSIKITNLFYQYPIRCKVADMLPTIREAGNYLLSLENPFNKTYCPWEIPCTYFPMTLIFYLPAVLLKFDLRFLSYIYLLSTLLLIYHYYRKRGLYIPGFLIISIVLSSKFIHFSLLSVQTFPYLFVLALILYALLENKEKLLWFSSAVALATRRIFLLFFPIIVIYVLKERKIKRGHVKSFIFGALFGFFPGLLYLKSFVLNQFNIYQHFSSLQKDNLFLKHSLGLSYYFFEHKKISLMIQIGLFILIYYLAVKFLKISNIWFFLSLVTIVFLFLLGYARPEEYYFFPLLIIIAFPLIKKSRKVLDERRFIIPSVLLLIIIFFSMIFFPYISGREYVINPLVDKQSITKSGYIVSEGYIEISIGGNLKLKKGKKIILFIKKREQNENSLKIRINERNFLDRAFDKRNMKIELYSEELDNFLVFGSNYLEVILLKPEKFYLKIRRN